MQSIAGNSNRSSIYLTFLPIIMYVLYNTLLHVLPIYPRGTVLIRGSFRFYHRDLCQKGPFAGERKAKGAQINNTFHRNNVIESYQLSKSLGASMKPPPPPHRYANIFLMHNRQLIFCK